MAATLEKAEIELKKKIALRLIELRESTGKRQIDFAYDLGMDKQTLNRLEKGRGATIYTVYKVCKFMGMTLSQFFDSPLFKDAKK